MSNIVLEVARVIVVIFMIRAWFGAFKIKNRPKKVKNFLWTTISSAVVFGICFGFILWLRLSPFSSIEINKFINESFVIPWVLSFFVICSSLIEYFCSLDGTFSFSLCFTMTFFCGALSIFDCLNFQQSKVYISDLVLTCLFAIVIYFGFRAQSIWNKKVCEMIEKKD